MGQSGDFFFYVVQSHVLKTRLMYCKLNCRAALTVKGGRRRVILNFPCSSHFSVSSSLLASEMETERHD